MSRLRTILTATLALTFTLFTLTAQAADAVYPNYKEAAMGGGANADLLTCDMRAVLVDTADYTYAATHEFLADVPVAARVAVSTALGTKSVTDGTFDSADFTWTSVTGDPSEAVILYCHTGSDATARLVVYIDTALTGFPVTPNGGDINFTVDAAGWFTL